MSTVQPSTASNAASNAARSSPWKAPSGQLHGTQAQFAALLFQAEDTPDAEGSATLLGALKNAPTDGTLQQDADTAAATSPDDSTSAVPTTPASGSPTPPPDWLLAWAAGTFHALPDTGAPPTAAMAGPLAGTSTLPPGADRTRSDFTRLTRSATPNGDSGALALPSGLGHEPSGVVDPGLLRERVTGSVPTPVGPSGQPTLVAPGLNSDEARSALAPVGFSTQPTLVTPGLNSDEARSALAPVGSSAQSILVALGSMSDNTRHSFFIAPSADSKSAEGLFGSQLYNPNTTTNPPGANRVRLNAWRGTLAGAPTLGMTTPSTVRLAGGHALGGSTTGAGVVATSTQPVAANGLAAGNGEITPTGRRSEPGLTGLTRADEPEATSLPGDTQEPGAVGVPEHRQSASDGQSGGASDASIDWGAPAEGVTAQAPAEAGAESAFQSQVDELVQQMEQWFAQGTQSASLTVDAGGERPVDIEVTLNRGQVSVRFGADETGTQEALLGSVEAALKPLLAQHGLSLQDVQLAPTPNPGAFAGQGGTPDPSTQGRQPDQGLSAAGGRGRSERGMNGSSGLEGGGPSASTALVRRSQGTVDLFA